MWKKKKLKLTNLIYITTEMALKLYSTLNYNYWNHKKLLKYRPGHFEKRRRETIIFLEVALTHRFI